MNLARLVNEMNGRPQPALTYISADERLDLSFHVLANWISKIANLLTLDVGAVQGDTLVIELPRHWRSIVWCIGAWTAGVEVEASINPAKTSADAQHRVKPDVLDNAIGWVGSDEDRAIELSDQGFAGEMWLQVLPSLALRWPGSLPDGIEDASQAIMSCADALLQPAERPAMAPPSKKIHDIVDQIAKSSSAPIISGGSLSELASVCVLAWQSGYALTIVSEDAGDNAKEVAQLWIN